ncbi:MAG: glycosyl transferase, group 1 [Frankiales bacterium]|jgi:glycosyltransferase involved in cell wall biosynthesis|nr:glycosyl transferase, group 1 [Frankiales bacterium]
MPASPAALPGPRAGSGSSSLRIAMVAPPYYAVPPPAYGGIESVVADLVDGLVERGHHLTLVAAGRRGTRAQRYLPACDVPRSGELGELLPELLHAARVGGLLEQLDIDLVHDHALATPLLARRRPVPTLVTAHGPVTGESGAYYRALRDTVRLVGLSDAQRGAAADLPWVATVPNGVRVETYPFRSDKEPFALFLGRFHPQKAPHLAIDAARAAGLPLVLAGKCSEPLEQEYFRRQVAPRLGPDVTVFGVADAGAKRDLLQRACCLLFPICWEEPFGLVMIEAMACGTPVVALRRGAVPEVVVDGVTGVVVDAAADLPAAVSAARRLCALDCRTHVEASFSTAAMTAGYEAAYRRVVADAEPAPGPWPQAAALGAAS